MCTRRQAICQWLQQLQLGLHRSLHWLGPKPGSLAATMARSPTGRGLHSHKPRPRHPARGLVNSGAQAPPGPAHPCGRPTGRNKDSTPGRQAIPPPPPTTHLSIWCLCTHASRSMSRLSLTSYCSSLPSCSIHNQEGGGAAEHARNSSSRTRWWESWATRTSAGCQAAYQ